MHGKSPDELIMRYRAGDASAFDKIYDRTYRTVYFTAFYIVKDRMLAEDVAQETYLSAFTKLDSFSEGNFTGWLVTIARNAALNLIKKRAREQNTDFDAESYRYGVYEQDVPFIFALAARTLSEEEYRIVMLAEVDGYKRREIAEMLGMPIGTVTWKYGEALKKLKKQLEKEGL